ncbi:transposase family protein [Streptomyces sp. NPDC048416]|uniref:transposase family protein n=1 Tax=Streptomyces sp. NPDC048416 TaxID=3365546 RepID=UPI003710F1F0
MVTARTKAFVLLDGTLLPIDRIAADTPYYSGKHKRHGMNVQVLTDPFGQPLWASPAPPGATHDLAAPAPTTSSTHSQRRASDAGRTRHTRVPAATSASRSGDAVKQWKRRHNSTHAKIRCLVEQAMAVLRDHLIW